MNISELKTGTKFQLTENFEVGNKVFPEGLVFSLVNITINSQGKYVFLKVIRCKPVIDKYYANIPKNFYIGPTATYMFVNKIKRTFVNVKLYRRDAQRFLDMVGTARLINFSREYENITK